MYVGGNVEIDYWIDRYGGEWNGSTVNFLYSYAGNRWVGSFTEGWEETDWSWVIEVLDSVHGKIHIFTNFVCRYLSDNIPMSLVGFWDRTFTFSAAAISDPTTGR